MRNNRHAFTLVEILIVVIILGILAAIVIPSFTNASTDSRRVSLVRQLHTLRSQIQLYIVEHEALPGSLAANSWIDLTERHADAKGRLRGPYLPSPPRNSLNQFTDVLVVDVDPTFGDAVGGENIGFVYNQTSGSVWATNSTGDKVFNEAQLNHGDN